MDGSNFQHLGGPAQMMSQQQQMQQQQRVPQTNNASAQIQSMIFASLQQQNPASLTGWRAQVMPNERIGLIFNLIGNLRLASQNNRDPPNLQKMVEIAIGFEKGIFEKSMNKDVYNVEVQNKLELLLERRNQNQATMQQAIHQQAQAQAHAQQTAQAQQQMMMNSMQAQGQRAMPQQAVQQGFSHLQRQMQASPLPGQQPQQAPMGLQNQGPAQNMIQNQQQQFAAMQQQQQGMVGRPTNGQPQPQMSPQDNVLVHELTNRLVGAASEDEKNTLRTSLQQRMDPVQFNRYQSQGLDPIWMYYRSQAMARIRAERSQRMQQAQQQQQMNLPGQVQNGQPVAPPMQPQRSMNPSPMNGQSQPPTSANPEFGTFMGNMGDLAAQQQQQGVLAQEAGQVVVPASAAPRNATPQPGVMAGQGVDMVDQRAGINPSARVQQQQQALNAQQLQQQRMQQHAQQQQQQQQSQARLSAQQKAQQTAGLRGQPGGMGPGPNPPQQSPAMATLNAPLRTPSQPIANPEPSQVNPNSQFGQPLDPRFMQGGQRPGPGMGLNGQGMNSAMQANIANMGLEGQRLLVGVPPDKIHDVVNKWHEARGGPMNAANMNGGKPQMPMQGMGQVRPGQQVPQAAQFNAQNGTNQFMMGNAAQRPPTSMATGMSAQQQMVLQQQMSNLRQTQMQQQRMPQNAIQMEQRAIAQMDNVDIPPVYQGHHLMPPNCPPEIKKWGQLKQWVQQTPNMTPGHLEGVRSLQKAHYTTVMRSRQQQNPAGGMPPGVTGVPLSQGGAPTAPMAAPVAPMGQNSSQMPIGTNMAGPGQYRQPTPQEIHQMRNHHTGKLLNATDEQIRTLLFRNHVQQMAQQGQGQGQSIQQQQQQRQQMMAQHRMQANGQQFPPNGVQSVPNQMGPGQPKSSQAPPSKQAQSGPNLGQQAHPDPAASANAANNRPNPRSQANGRNAAQNSSPVAPSKNLKRASSDDVVEVPNPNGQQPRPAPQQVQGSSQMPRQPFTPQQIAALDPELRKKYLAHMAQMQANQGQKPQISERLKTIMREEQEKLPPPMVDIPMDEDTKRKTAQAMLNILAGLNNVSKALPRWFDITLDEAQARRFLQARSRFQKQFRGDITQPNPPLKDVFSITIGEVDHVRTMLSGIIRTLSDKFPNMKKPDGAKAQSSSAPQTDPQGSAQPPTPLNAANLQQQQQQLNKLHQRTNSRSSHTPAAPTSAQPPFQFGAVSPHGTPAYGAGRTLKQEDLHIPARKKQKQNSTPVPGQTTPGSTSSPQVVKAVSPDIKRQQQDPRTHSKPSLCCPEPECDRHHVGFESQEALRAHTQEEHIRPLDNPLKYVQENLAATLGLDSEGRAKKSSIPAGQENGAGAKMAPSGSRQGQTPNMKGEHTPAGTTPMNRQVSMTGQSSSGGKPTMQTKGIPAKNAPVKAQPNQKDSTRAKEAQSTQEAAPVDPWQNSTVDPHDLFQTFQAFETGAAGAISDMNVYRSITPNDTPESSKDGVSEPNSDISEGVGLDISLDSFDDKWAPFGANDTEGLFDLSSFNVNGEEDAFMFDTDQPAVNYQTWDDMVDDSAFNKPFSFDTSLYSMNAE